LEGPLRPKTPDSRRLIEARDLLRAAGVTVRRMPAFARLDRLIAVFAPIMVHGEGGAFTDRRRNDLVGQIATADVWELVGLPYPAERTQADNRVVGSKMKAYGWERTIVLESGKVPYAIYSKGTAEERLTKICVFTDPTGDVEVRAISPDDWPTLNSIVTGAPIGRLIRALPPL